MAHREREIRKRSQISIAVAHQKLISQGLGSSTVLAPIEQAAQQRTEQTIAALPPQRTVYATPEQRAKWGPGAWAARAQERSRAPEARPDPQMEAAQEEARWRQRQMDRQRMDVALKRENRKQQNRLARQKIMRLGPLILDNDWGINDETDPQGFARGRIRTLQQAVQKGALYPMDAWPIIMKLLEDYATGAPSMAQKMAQQAAKEQEAIEREEARYQQERQDKQAEAEQKRAEATRKEETRVREAREKEATRVRERQEDIVAKRAEKTAAAAEKAETARLKAEEDEEQDRKEAYVQGLADWTAEGKRLEGRVKKAGVLKKASRAAEDNYNDIEATLAKLKRELSEYTEQERDTSGILSQINAEERKREMNETRHQRTRADIAELATELDLDVKKIQDNPSLLVREYERALRAHKKARPKMAKKPTSPTTQATTQPSTGTTQPVQPTSQPVGESISVDDLIAELISKPTLAEAIAYARQFKQGADPATAWRLREALEKKFGPLEEQQ